MVSNSIFLCLLSSGLLILSFPKFNISFLAYISFVLLFFAIENKSRFRAFLIFYFSGVFFWLGTIFWLIHVTFAGMIVLVLYLALYFGVFGLLISRYSLLSTRYSMFIISSLWVVLEYLRAHLLTGFSWSLLGHSQYLNLPIIQMADITGAYGVSFLLMMVNVLLYRLIRAGRERIFRKIYFLFSIFIFLLVLGYGFFRLNQKLDSQGLKICVVQGNIPQALKWDESAKPFIWRRYLELTKEASGQNPDLIIWPESAVPDYLDTQMGTDSNSRLSQIESSDLKSLLDFVKEIKIPILLGVTTVRADTYFNSAILVSQGGEIINRYDKIHLVPFGEYIPLRKILPFLETIVPIGDFTPGKKYTVFSCPINFSVLICFEDIFPEISRQFAKLGADFLVNITNDAWFGDTSAPYQHLSCSVFRAVENRVSLARAANTGISCVIDSNGQIISMVQDLHGAETFVSGFNAKQLFLNRRFSFYTKFGDVFIYACMLFLGYNIFGLLKTTKY